MPTPRSSGPPGQTKAPPFGKSKSNVPKAGPQPPIPAKKPKSPSVGKPFGGKGAPPFTKKGAPSPGMKGLGGY